MIKQILAMKSFDNENYYKLLEIRPDASPFQVRRAYKKSMEIYREESMVSYSLFLDSRRKQILTKLENAFTTLIDRDSRYKYDLKMVRSGFITREEFSAESKAIALVREGKEQSKKIKPATILLKQLGKNKISTPVLNRILEKEVFTGGDLKQMRMELGISLKDIAKRTKIRVPLLKAIEDDEYDRLPSRFHLKNFLRAYINCLVVDADVIVERYLERIDD